MVTVHASIGAGERDRRGEAGEARAGVRRQKKEDGPMVRPRGFALIARFPEPAELSALLARLLAESIDL